MSQGPDGAAALKPPAVGPATCLHPPVHGQICILGFWVQAGGVGHRWTCKQNKRQLRIRIPKPAHIPTWRFTVAMTGDIGTRKVNQRVTSYN